MDFRLVSFYQDIWRSGLSFADDYVEQLEKAIPIFVKSAFPDMEEFERSSLEDIKNNNNVCRYCKVSTEHRIYPDYTWICDEHAQFMFKSGLLAGRIVFDMRKP